MNVSMPHTPGDLVASMLRALRAATAATAARRVAYNRSYTVICDVDVAAFLAVPAGAATAAAITAEEGEGGSGEDAAMPQPASPVPAASARLHPYVRSLMQPPPPPPSHLPALVASAHATVCIQVIVCCMSGCGGRGTPGVFGRPDPWPPSSLYCR
ncbi:hypothetical protein HK405_011446, partial [Cladochytrium tenue]